MAIVARTKANNIERSPETIAKIQAARKKNTVDFVFAVQGTPEQPSYKFIFSDKLFSSLDLNEKGLMSAYDNGVDENGVDTGVKKIYLAVVPEAEATIAKGRKNKEGALGKKGRTFSSSVLLEDLQDAGLISKELSVKDKAKFDLTKVEGGLEIEGSVREIVFEVTALAADSDKEDDTEETESEVASEVTDSTKSTKAKKETATVEDEF